VSDFLRYELGFSRNLVAIIPTIITIIVVLVILSVVMSAVNSRRKKDVASGIGSNTGFLSMRGRTSEQKKVIKYFNSTGILGAIFRMSDFTFDSVLSRKVFECGTWISARALYMHGMDADEVNEIPPILVENYSLESDYYKMFRDRTYRASKYQMSYLMFSEKQMYAYSYTFDLTNANTTERTREYFYEDITSIDVTHRETEFPNPRPLGYLLGGIACILFGIILFSAGIAGIIFGLSSIITGIILASFIGYSRSKVDVLILKLTVSGNEFVCAMKYENIAAIQGMKAKLREKKA